ncbi:MAG TPA: fibronectin type III domain-containing protein [Bacteroidales bacterium]|nr:fibronectin type III domain-containing protein [Bacteroidales bacterium]
MKRAIGIFVGFVLCMALSAQDSIRISLAEWTFDNWYGGGILPYGQTIDKPILADRGSLNQTAKIGTEQMFTSATVERVWSVPTTGGYVRCSKNWVAGPTEAYFMISGLHTLGVSSINLTSSHATSSSSQTYALKVQYRLGLSLPWKDLYGPFSVTDVTESGISRRQVNNVKLPAECNNVSYIDIRWLCTTFPSSSSTQFRLDNIYLTASMLNPEPNADKTSLIAATSMTESDWAVPSWTLLLAARKKANEIPLTENLTALTTVMNKMLSKDMPYCINTSFNGDPTTNMGFAWYTNAGVTGGQVQLVAKENAILEDFATPLLSVDATCTSLSNVNYVVTANDPPFTADLPVNTKRSYVSNKALATGLAPNTTYSYRVGKANAWSSIRSFRTAKNTKDEFSFIYFTDTQANSNDNFDCSSNTVTQAFNKSTDPLFALMTGDFVESQGSSNSEWEYEQFFERMQNVWSKLPLVATIGNHDASSSNNFFNHLNNEVSFNQTATSPSTMNGTVYSFVVGDALFMIVNHEDVSKSGYLASLGNWMTEQVNAHPSVRWRIVGVHSGLFSGGSHLSDASNVTLRNALLPYYQNLKIDLSINGHDHVYNTIGPVDPATKSVVAGSVQKVESAPVVVSSNMNGKSGGTFDVSQGTFYFSNNSASRKKYTPTSQSSMISSASSTQVGNYWSLFTGRFGQTGEPTFSTIRVTTDTIFITTYAINNVGETYLFDVVKVTKNVSASLVRTQNEPSPIEVDFGGNRIKVSGLEANRIELYDLKGQLIAVKKNTNHLSTTQWNAGFYLVRVYSDEGVFHKKVLI